MFSRRASSVERNIVAASIYYPAQASTKALPCSAAAGQGLHFSIISLPHAISPRAPSLRLSRHAVGVLDRIASPSHVHSMRKAH